MKTLTIDVNAHIANIFCDIAVDGNNSTVSISFDNITNKAITAVKFNATGYNTFGDIVPVNEKNNFFVIIQDIKIDGNSHIAGLKAKIPNEEIRKIELEESQICYSDGTVSTYLGKDIREFQLTNFDEDMNGETIRAIKDRYGEKLCVHAAEFNCGWICSCQRLNNTPVQKCSCCGNDKTDILNLNNPETVARILSEYQLKEQKRQEMEKATAIQKEKENKKRKVKICIGTVIGVIIAIIIGHTMIMAGRTTFASETEMKEALQGTYTYYEGYEAQRQIEIKGDQFRYIYKYTDSNHWMDIDWYPEKGVIHTFEDIVVTNNGDLKVDGELYEQGGYMSTKSNYTSSYESGYSVLKITVDSVSHNSGYTVCTGSVKNTGNKTYKYIEVKGSFKDSAGNVIDTDWTYAAGSEGLSPNESTTFRLSVTKDLDIKSCSVSLLDFD